MLPTKEEKDIAFSIVSLLMQNGLYDALNYHNKHDDCYSLGIYEWEHDNGDLLITNGIECQHGYTKLCLISSKLDNWVIKLSFIRSSNPYYVAHKTDKDFCSLEAEYYQKACDNNLGDFFAATYDIGEVNGLHIFLQEKAEPNEDFFLDQFEKYIEEGEDPGDYEDEDDYHYTICDLVEDMDNSERICAVYGCESDNLISFIDNNHINDLHEANYGFTKDGRAVIFDFSGYC